MIAPTLDGLMLARMVAALAAVLVLLAVAFWLLRRHAGRALQGFSPGNRLTVAASQAVGANVRLVLVRRDATEHLLAIGPHGVSLIESLPGNVETRPAGRLAT